MLYTMAVAILPPGMAPFVIVFGITGIVASLLPQVAEVKTPQSVDAGSEELL
jgi:hypothetical protein